jgi:hypothetical protein
MRILARGSPGICHSGIGPGSGVERRARDRDQAKNNVHGPLVQSGRREVWQSAVDIPCALGFCRPGGDFRLPICEVSRADNPARRETFHRLRVRP